MKIFLMVGLLSMMLPCALQASERTLTEKDAGKEVLLKKGDLLTVKLPSNPSAGYDWNCLVIGGGLLKQEGDVVRENKETARGIVGVPVTEIWKFRALEVGSLKMTFNYARPWEKGEPPARTLHWPVTIQP